MFCCHSPPTSVVSRVRCLSRQFLQRYVVRSVEKTKCECTECQSIPESLWMQPTVKKYCFSVYKCLHGLAPSYLADERHHLAESEFWRRLRSASSHELSVPRTRLSTYGDRAFPVTAVRIWNSLCSTIHPRHHFRSSALAWRHTSSNCVIHKTFVVPAKWYHHFGHVNRFTYLLTY